MISLRIDLCRPFCYCTCPQNFYGTGGSDCTPCPANSTAPAGSKYASDCICKRNFITVNSSCIQCNNHSLIPFTVISDNFTINSGTRGWEGTQLSTVCGQYGPVLGGYGVLGDKNYLRKTYTNLCKHNSVVLSFTIVAIDGWEGETISLFVDNAEVRCLPSVPCMYK